MNVLDSIRYHAFEIIVSLLSVLQLSIFEMLYLILLDWIFCDSCVYILDCYIFYPVLYCICKQGNEEMLKESIPDIIESCYFYWNKSGIVLFVWFTFYCNNITLSIPSL